MTRYFSPLSLSKVLSLVIILWLGYYTATYYENSGRLTIIFLMISLILWVLHELRRKKLHPLVGVFLIGLSVLVGVYFYQEFDLLVYERAGANTTLDFIMAGIAIPLFLLAAWRTTGPSLPIVVLVFLLYAFFGRLFPGIFFHGGLSWRRMLQMSVLEMSGIFGSLPQLGTTMLIIFSFYAGLIGGFGGMDFIINVSKALTRKFRYGLTQATVVGSMIFGSFSGSAAANAAGVGSFTIPLMKRFGIPPALAGAFEAVACSGGQIMPPVMGAAAFLMADFLEVSYWDIVTMAWVPALIYYICVAVTVYMITRRVIGEGAPVYGGEIPGLRQVFLRFDSVPIVISVVVLMFALGYVRLSVLPSGFLAVFSFLIVRLFYSLASSKERLSHLREYGRKALNGLADAASPIMSIMIMLAVMGIVVRVLVVTGLAQTLAFLMVDLAGGRLLVLLLLIAVVSILFGMAVSTVAAYLLVVLLAAPALNQLGVEPRVAHFVVFVLSLLSSITPPVATAVAVTSSISGAPFMKVAWHSCKVGAPLFLLAFVFVAEPDLLAAGLPTIPAALKVLTGLLAVTYGIHGSFKGAVGNVKRLAYFILGGLGLFYPLASIRLACLAIVLLLWGAGVFQARIRARRRRQELISKA